MSTTAEKLQSTTKTCTVCGKDKDRSLYYTYLGKTGNRLTRPACTECTLEQSRIWRVANRAWQAAYKRAYRLANPDHDRGVQRRRAARRWAGMTPEDIALAKAYIKALNGSRCHYCNGPRRAGSIDHKIPLARGGTTHYYNLVPCCGPCNVKKHTKTAEEFVLLKSWEGDILSCT